MVLGKFIRLLPKSNLKKGISFLNKGEFGKACRTFESYMTKIEGEIATQNQAMVRMYMVESYIGYSKKLASKGKTLEAANQLEKAIELEPNYADVHFGLSALYERIGRNTDSRKCLEAALKINPNYFRARIMLSKSYHSAGENRLAIEELNKSLSCSPAFYIEQVKELMQIIDDVENESEIKSIYHRLLEEKPSSSEVSKQIAMEAIQNGNYDFAVAELKKSISMNPNYPDLHNLLGVAYANMGMTDDAIMEFETALKIHPGYLKARLNIALGLYEKGANDESMHHLERFLKLDPENELANNLYRELQPVP